VRAARAALFLRVIALAALGVYVTQWGWAAIENVFLEDEAPPRLARLTERPAPALWKPLAGVRPAQALAIRAPSAEAIRVGDLLPSDTRFDAVDRYRYAGPLVRGWAWVVQPLAALVDASGWKAILALLLAGAWVMAVWALVGGAIARIAALYLTRGEAVGPVVALRSAAVKWPSSFAAPSFCFGIIVLFAMALAFVGLIIRITGFLAFLAALVWPLALMVGVAIAVFAIGLVVGWPFMWSTIAVERTDAFDGVSRGYAFTYQRPLHLLFFVIVATVLGLLAQAAVSLLVDGSLRATHWAVERGAGDAKADVLLDGVYAEGEVGVLDRAASRMIYFWSALVASLASAFPMAYLFPTAVGMYLLLRRLIDSTELGDVSFDDGGPEPGLPPLATDPATGVPAVQARPMTAAAPPPESSSTVTELRGGST
jgi:hypothetical protein